MIFGVETGQILSFFGIFVIFLGVWGSKGVKKCPQMSLFLIFRQNLKIRDLWWCQNTITQSVSPILMVLGVIWGPPNGPKINKKLLFVVTFFVMRFCSMFSCIFAPSRLIWVDSGSRGEPFGYVKHRSKCTFAFSDIFVIF